MSEHGECLRMLQTLKYTHSLKCTDFRNTECLPNTALAYRAAPKSKRMRESDLSRRDCSFERLQSTLNL